VGHHSLAHRLSNCSAHFIPVPGPEYPLSLSANRGLWHGTDPLLPFTRCDSWIVISLFYKELYLHIRIFWKIQQSLETVVTGRRLAGGDYFLFSAALWWGIRNSERGTQGRVYTSIPGYFFWGLATDILPGGGLYPASDRYKGHCHYIDFCSGWHRWDLCTFSVYGSQYGTSVWTHTESVRDWCVGKQHGSHRHGKHDRRGDPCTPDGHIFNCWDHRRIWTVIPFDACSHHLLCHCQVFRKELGLYGSAGQEGRADDPPQGQKHLTDDEGFRTNRNQFQHCEGQWYPSWSDQSDHKVQPEYLPCGWWPA